MEFEYNFRSYFPSKYDIALGRKYGKSLFKENAEIFVRRKSAKSFLLSTQRTALEVDIPESSPFYF